MYIKNIKIDGIIYKYSLNKETFKPFNRLVIQRKDKKEIPNEWNILQKLKEKIIPNQIMVQIYPCEKDIQDERNEFIYHLWYWEDMEKQIPNLNSASIPSG